MMSTYAAGRAEHRPTISMPREAPGAVLRLLVAAIALWGVMCGLGFLLAHPLRGTAFEHGDGAVNRRFAAHRSDAWNSITHWLTYLGETVTVIAVCAVFFVVLRLVLGRWRESLFLAAGLSGQALIFLFTQLVISRHRPSVHRLDPSPPTSSFPSGHTSAAMTLYVGLAIVAARVARHAWLRAVALAVAIAFPICVAVARLYRGMHFPTDVAGSAILAGVWLTVTWAVILRDHRSEVLSTT
jgi:undecaprenyl-diphosphatase